MVQRYYNGVTLWMVVGIQGGIATRLTRGVHRYQSERLLLTYSIDCLQLHRSIRRPSNKDKTIVIGDDMHTNFRVTQSRS